MAYSFDESGHRPDPNIQKQCFTKPQSVIKVRTVMSKHLAIPLSLIASCLVGFGLTACGGSSSGATRSSSAVAEVGGTPITRSAVSHWMATLAGGDYYQLSHKHVAPDGLASDPPNYAACVASLETTIANSPAPTKSAAQTSALLTKCHQIYQALRFQATAYLVNAQWELNTAKELGLTPSQSEVTRLYDDSTAKEYPTPAKLNEYFAARKLSLADELFIIKLDVLGQKIERGGQKLLAKFIEAGRKSTAKTDCSAGYVVLHCKQYTGEAQTAKIPSASVMMEQVAALATGVCINVAACGEL